MSRLEPQPETLHETGFQLPEFEQADLLARAVTHKSYAKEQGQGGADNERLEFLGDAILTFLCGEYLYRAYPQADEGELTQLRASLVDQTQLAAFALELGLNHALQLGKGVENSQGRSNPRLLSSAFESLIGAYFLDLEGDVDAVRQYLEPFFVWALKQRQASAAVVNVKSQFQAWALAEIGEVPDYVITAESGPDHAKVFVAEVRVQGQTYGRGSGAKKQAAEKQAARAALVGLGLLGE
jgi:ribonuclease-3